MRRSWRAVQIVVTAATLAAITVSHSEGALPSWPELSQWFEFAATVERGLRDGDPTFALELKKSTGGSSVYVKVRCKGEVVGAFLSENSSTSVEGEIGTFNIGRALGCGRLFQPAIKMELRGQGLTTFRELIEAASFIGDMEQNRQKVLAEMQWDKAVLHGVFKQWLPEKPAEYLSIERPEVPPNGALNESDPVAKFLKQDAPQPGIEEVTPPGLSGHAPARELGKELSNILLVDALAGQWDRFSGANLHAYIGAGKVRFMALDNGGANFSNDQGYLERFTRWVTRFDRTVTVNLFSLEQFLEAPEAHPFLGFQDQHSLAVAMDISEPEDWDCFRARVHKVAAHVRAVAAIGGGAWFEETK